MPTEQREFERDMERFVDMYEEKVSAEQHDNGPCVHPADEVCPATQPAGVSAIPGDKAAPQAWMRRWAFEGKPAPPKVKNGKGRWVWPAESKFNEVTNIKIFADDVPLYAVNTLPVAEKMYKANVAALAALRYLRDKDTAAWEMNVTPEICNAWDDLREAIALFEAAKGAK